MPDALEVITSVISEHCSIREQINDVDALFTVQRTQYQTAWSASSVNELIKNREQLIQTVNTLEDGLKNHFSYEEKVLPLVLGELIMKNILQEHPKILEQIENARAILISLEGLDQDELLSKGTVLQQSINTLSQTIENHAHHEDTILNNMKKCLEENASNRD